MKEGHLRGGVIAGSVAQGRERGGTGTNSSRRMRDNAAHPRSLICIHPVPFPAETTTFYIYRLPRQYLTASRRSIAIALCVVLEMRIFRAIFRLVLSSRLSFRGHTIRFDSFAKFVTLDDLRNITKKISLERENTHMYTQVYANIYKTN